MIAIRRAREDEPATLAGFAARLFRETYLPACRAEDVEAYASAAFTSERFAAELREGATLLAEVDGRLAGYAQLRLGGAPPGIDGTAPVEIARFYVDAPWHGRGVAARLMSAVHRAAAERGGGVLWLSVWEENGRAIAFYRRCGFVAAGSATFTMGADVQRDHLMARGVEG